MVVAVEERTRAVAGHAKVLLHVDVELLQHLRAHLLHALLNLLLHVGLQLLEGTVDFSLRAALLVDLPDARLDVDGVCLAQHLVAGTKHIVEELELRAEQVEHAHIGIVAQVDEVDHHHVVLLSVAVATANALLYALRIPGQVVVDDQRAELKVQALGSRLGSNHNVGLVLEVVYGGGTAVGSLDAAHTVGMLQAPPPVYLVGLRFAGLAVEEHYLAFVAVGLEEIPQESLRLGGFGEDEGFSFCPLRL